MRRLGLGQQHAGASVELGYPRASYADKHYRVVTEEFAGRDPLAAPGGAGAGDDERVWVPRAGEARELLGMQRLPVLTDND